MRTSRISLTLSMLLISQSLCATFAAQPELLLAQSTTQSPPQGTPSGDGVTTFTPTQTTTTSTTTTPPASTTPSASTTPPAEGDKWPWMEKEKAQPGSTSFGPGAKTGSVEERQTAAPALKIEKPVAAVATPKAAAKPMQLFGRIEQLSGSSGAAFPQLKAMTPKLDPRGIKLQARAADTLYSGNIVKSFPTNYQGTWGGDLQLQVVQLDPLYYRLDPMEARRTQQAMRLGSTGAVNFMFQNLAGGKVALEPARVMFMVPSSETEVGAQMDQMFGAGGANNPMAAMMKSMVGNVSVPVMLEFGNINTAANAGMGEMGVSGNQMRATVVRNVIRQLAGNVLEQQIVTQITTWSKQTGQPRTSFGETVVRFTSRDPQTMYVQAASVNYSGSKQFLDKIVLGGWVQKGVVKNTNPMGAMGGMGGMGDLQKMMGNPGAAGGGMPQIPGMDPNMLKNLLGQ